MVHHVCVFDVSVAHFRESCSLAYELSAFRFSWSFYDKILIRKMDEARILYAHYVLMLF